MKILIISQPESPHTLSFLKMIKRVYPLACIHLFPSTPFPLSPETKALCDYSYHHSNIPQTIYYQAYWDDVIAKPLSEHSGDANQLCEVIKKYRPDFVHVNAMQDAGYLLNKAFEHGLAKDFKLVYSIWGVDIHAFMHNPSHRDRIIKFLRYVDLIVPESSRELNLAKKMGYLGKFTENVEATLTTYDQILSSLPVSANKENLIFVKSAYQAQRTNNGVFLRALANCLDLLKNWQVVLTNPSLEDYKNLQMLVSENRVKIKIFLNHLPRKVFLEILSRSRYMAAINLSDGVSNTFLECCGSMTYPILSINASMEDWYNPLIKNVMQLDPYDVSDATCLLRDLFNNQSRLEQSVQYNKTLLQRYTEDRVNNIVSQFYR
jgi:hypothetical protein